MHHDTLQFVHDKLINAPVGVEAREKELSSNGADISERMLGVAPIRCMASLIRELARRWRRTEQERQLGHPVRAGHHELDEPGIDLDVSVPSRSTCLRRLKLLAVGSL